MHSPQNYSTRKATACLHSFIPICADATRPNGWFRWRIYRLIGTACPMWWIRISFIDSAISANPRRCIYSKAARCPASERARKLGAIKLRKRMFGRTLRSEPFTPSSIPHQEDGMAIIMWQSFPKNCPRMYLGKCTAITPNCSANIRMSWPFRMLSPWPATPKPP